MLAGSYLDNLKIDALFEFALGLVKTSGWLYVQALALVRAAAFTRSEIAEAIAAMSAILFTNTLNRTNESTLDFPRPD